jgi:lipoprotein NlpD
VDAPTALAGLCVCLLAAGCASTRAPVAERPVDEYRRASKPPEPPRRTSPPAPKPSATAEAAPAPAASKPAPSAPKPPASTDAVPAPAGEAAPEGDWRPELYTVKRGDTLYGIALDHGLDYKELSAWNQLGDPNLIRVGQQLRLHPPPGWKPEPAEPENVIARPVAAQPQIEARPLEPPPPPKSGPKGIKVPYSEQALAQLQRDPSQLPGTDPKAGVADSQAEPRAMPAPAAATVKPAPPAAPMPVPPVAAPTPPTAPIVVAPAPPLPAPASPDTLTPQVAKSDVPDAEGSIVWMWPASGKLLHPFNQGANPKGVSIGGSAGQAVLASASGKVVYSGSGLRGYGKLIIIKHNNTYLSVYAHNRELLVKEGERVSRGQKIAEMGGSDAQRAGLHFEIRRLGKPVDPLKYLPLEGAG